MPNNPANSTRDLIDQIGGVDVYLLDQIVKGRFINHTRILDAGCGGGRNAAWFIRNGYDVSAVDISPVAVASIRQQAANFAPSLSAENFRVEPVEKMTFGDRTFDAVLSIAVLHFAHDEAHFRHMLNEMWRVLRPGGILFARLGSTIGIEHLVRPLGQGRYAVPDGSSRFLVSLETLTQLTFDLHANLLEPIKTVNVENLRCMTTWVVEKQ